MLKVLIVGKSSKVFSVIEKVFNEHFELYACSHRELVKYSKQSFDLVLILSLAPTINGNQALFEEIYKSIKSTKYVYLSSVVCFLKKYQDKFKYIKLKIEAEKSFLLTFKDLEKYILRCGVITYLENEYPIITNPRVIATKLNNLTDEISILYKKSFTSQPPCFYRILLKLELFYFARFFDLFFKLFGAKNYGYTYLVNKELP